MRTFVPKHGQLRPRASFDLARPKILTGLATTAVTRFGHDFSRIPVHANVPAEIQTKPVVNAPGDVYEQEADRVAEQVMNTREPAHPPLAQRETVYRGDGLPGDSKGGGSPLPHEVRAFMEPRFGFDFGQVRVHTDRDARLMSRSLNAQAFTHQQHIYFGAERSPGKDATTAHELAHVVQQTGARGSTHVPSIQRVLEVRPPGRGEASAYGRRQELIDRLNTMSTAIQYWLDGDVIRYTVSDEAALTHFDRQMRGFIDRAEVVPMRLITSAGLVMGPGGYQTLLADSFTAGYVDLDDLLADDDYSFRSDLLHFLTERFHVPGYERMIGTPALAARFDPAHMAGKEAEAAFLRALLNDPSIYWVYDGVQPSGVWLNAFRSRDENYWVFQVVARPGRAIAGGTMHVRTRDGRRLTIDQFRAERGLATPATAPATAPATVPAVP